MLRISLEVVAELNVSRFKLVPTRLTKKRNNDTHRHRISDTALEKLYRLQDFGVTVLFRAELEENHAINRSRENVFGRAKEA
jgi:hypothetical protein